MSAMKEQYGKDRGEEVFYATKNKGKITGVEKAAMGKSVRPRAAQFGRDIGVSTAEAKALINEGRRRKDGGSTILESNMNKMRGFEAGGSAAKSEGKRKKKLRAKLHKEHQMPTHGAQHKGTKADKITEKYKDSDPGQKKHIKEIQDELGIKKYKIQKPNLKSR